jgi:hypothetical protein
MAARWAAYLVRAFRGFLHQFGYGLPEFVNKPNLKSYEFNATALATPGLWNSEWTWHGPFFEKIKDRLVQPITPGGGGGPFAGGSGGAGQTSRRRRLRRSN